MNERIDVSIERVQEIIDSFDGEEFSTIDVLRKYSGGFYSNKETPAYYSFNAQFGKLLKRNETEFGISETEKNVSAKDDNGNQTSTSKWRQSA